MLLTSNVILPWVQLTGSLTSILLPPCIPSSLFGKKCLDENNRVCSEYYRFQLYVTRMTHGFYFSRTSCDFEVAKDKVSLFLWIIFTVCLKGLYTASITTTSTVFWPPRPRVRPRHNKHVTAGPLVLRLHWLQAADVPAAQIPAPDLVSPFVEALCVGVLDKSSWCNHWHSEKVGLFFSSDHLSSHCLSKVETPILALKSSLRYVSGRTGTYNIT